MDVFRIFRPSGERKEDRPDKRRAQVRRAQQTYRLRKDRYTKSLENEVARLRAIETDLLHETQHLGNTVRALSNLLADHGIYVDVATRLPREETRVKPDQGLPGCHAGEGAQLNLSPASPFGEARSFWPEFWEDSCPTTWQDDSPVSLDWPVPANDHHHDILAIPVTSIQHVPKPRVGDLDPTAMGMEFVLALEKPCLAHIHGDPENPHQANGHALTVSSHLLMLSTQPPSPPSPEYLSEACAKAPASILDRLLTLSTNLAAEGEVTPAQAWNRIRCQPKFGRLKMDGLRAFTRKLGEAAKCHGFGAVFKEQEFEKLLREALTGELVF